MLFGILVQELKEKKRVCQELLIYKFVYLESTLWALDNDKITSICQIHYINTERNCA